MTRFAVGDSTDGSPVDVRPERVELTPHGSSFDLSTCAGKPRPVRTPLVGSFNVANALAAATTALARGLRARRDRRRARRPIVVPGRIERVDAGQDFTVLVDYAHTPDALRVGARRRPRARRPGGRLVVVFGCGGDRDRAKRPLMGEIAASSADLAILTSDNPRSEDPETIADEIMVGVADDRTVERILDRRAAIRAALAVGPRRRRRGDRGQGPRDRADDRRPHRAVRRPRRRPRRARSAGA